MIGTSAQWVRKLNADGYFQRTADGNVSRGEVVRGYARFLEDDARRISKSEPARQLVAARLREVELRIARTERTLCDTEDAIEAMREVVDTCRSEMTSPTRPRVDYDPEIKRRISAAVDLSFQCIEKVLARQADRLRAGGRPWDSPADDE